MIWLGFLIVIFGHVTHTLLEAGKDFSSFKAYIKDYPISIILGFITSIICAVVVGIDFYRGFTASGLRFLDLLDSIVHLCIIHCRI